MLLTPVSNDAVHLAQSLPNPVVVGGYVNRAGAGEQGPLFQAGDVNDYFDVSLLPGQVIELAIANPQPDVDDLDLDVLSSTGALVQFSAGIGATERITFAGTAGRYFVRVYPFSGASNYVLTIGRTGTTAVGGGLTSDAQFVPGQLLVKARAVGPPAAGGAADKQAGIAAALGLTPQKSAPGMHSVLKLTPTAMQALAQQPSAPAVDGAPRAFASDELRLKWETVQALKTLRALPDVEWAEPNWVMQTFAVPNDPLFQRQRWHYEQISLPAAWDVTTGDANVVVAVVDSGVRPHSELAPKFALGYDFVDVSISGDGDGDDSDPSDPGRPVQGGLSFHGTHVAGTIGAVSNEANGVAGVAWGARIMPIRVMGVNGSGFTEDIIQGMRFAARLPNRSGVVPAKAADVINLSLGGPGVCSAAYQEAVDAVRAAGVIVIAAAGNDGVSGNFQPAGCDGVVSVAALGPDRTGAPYSNFGTGVDVAAPGGDRSVDRDGDGDGDGIVSTFSLFDGTSYFSTHTSLQGTSMAAPHVAGVVALMKSVNPALTPASFDGFLASGALTDDILTPGADAFGIGLINANKAVRVTGTPPPPPTQLTVLPTSLNFGDAVTANDVIVTASGAATVATVETSAPWLTVTPISVDAGNAGTYRLHVNRASLAVGTYNGWVEFRPPQGGIAPARVSILMQVTNTPLLSDAGQHYVLLVDAETFDSAYQEEVYVRGPSVSFSFDDVVDGEYLLVAGTDNDNDGTICDDGEACGEYPLYGEAAVIEVTADIADLDMVTGYRSSMIPLELSSGDSTKSLAARPRGYRLLRAP